MSAPAVRYLTVAAATAAASAVLLAGCGGGAGNAGASPSNTPTKAAPSHNPTSPAASTTPASTAPARTGPPSCTAAALTVALGATGSGAGSSYLPLQFTNKTTATCVLYGFPGVAYVTGTKGSQVGAPATGDGPRSPAVTLRPGMTASALLQESAFGDFNCSPVSVRGLRVYPPGSYTAAFVSQPGQACGTKVKQLFVHSIVSGTSGT